MGFLRFINEPYPYYYRHPFIGKITLVVFLFTFLFYFLLQPFDVNRAEHKFHFFWISIIHATPPLIILLLQGITTSQLIKTIDKWTVGKEFIFFGFPLLFVGIGQFLIRDLIYYNPENWSAKYLIEETRNTFLVGVVFISIWIPLNFYRMKANHSKRATILKYSAPDQTDTRIIKIKTKVKSETFDLNLHDFLFARAEGNYLRLTIKEENHTKKILKRLSLNELESQIPRKENVFKSHRSYLINMNNIGKISGNAAGFKVSFVQGEETALVSRNRIESFENRIKGLK